MFGYTIIEDIFNNNINEDWKVMKLIPPKTKKELRKQYRLLSLKYHPDKGGDPADFIKLKNSYDNLILCC
jgi:preprotein translocase subunit Sec63